MSQTERILFIDRCLRNSGTFTIKQVCGKFEVSERQVKRDIEYMRDRFEAPIEWNAAKRAYVYAQTFEQLKFADQHLILAYLSMQSMLKNANYFPAVSSELLEGLKKQIPKEYLGICDKILYQVSTAENLDPFFFTEICSSLREKLCLDVVYTNSKNQETNRTIEPCNLINYGGNWYVVAFDYLRSALRTFNVARIKKLSLTKKAFMQHEADFEEKLKTHIDSGFGIFFGEKTQTVKIRFTAFAVQIVRTQLWHPKQTVTEGEKDGEAFIDLSFPAAKMTEAHSKILSFGKNAVPLEPPELVEMWKTKIREMYSII